MGISSDGMLYFGFNVGEKDEPPNWLPKDEDEQPIEFDEWICQLAGVENEPYSIRKAVIDACPAELKMYCSYEYPMYVLCVRGDNFEYRVNRGYNEEIDFDKLKNIDQEKIIKFKEWCEKHSIEYNEPKWLLCSMYG